MTKIRNLEGPIIENDLNTKFLVCFLHGWGSDGNDLIQIGELWKSQLQNALLISPNAPEACEGTPSGRQWFDILSNNEEKTLKGLHNSYLDLKNFLDFYLKYILK